ncbi:MAG TPA: class I SAM-dependent methyltransferase [Steroidobacteraceae bacterium]|nr:class I SAM-dependent methyltransferase [Steroidobacteraceae bacterium]
MIEKLLFDRDYYQRFYFNSRTAVTSRAEMGARGRLIAGFAEHIGQPVARILDAGCGVGLLRRPLRRAFPRAEYVGLEVSDYLCKRYGWRQGSIAALRTRERYDIAVCYDVMQYLTPTEARQAIATLGRVCRGLLYFGALTREDWEDNCDRTRTDPDVMMRPATWYRRELARDFRPMGAGFWLRRNSPLHVWEMDTAGR